MVWSPTAVQDWVGVGGGGGGGGGGGYKFVVAINAFTDVRFTEDGGTWKLKSPYIRPLAGPSNRAV